MQVQSTLKPSLDLTLKPSDLADPEFPPPALSEGGVL